MATARRGHYRLYAYVCGVGCVQHPDVDGTVTFFQVFMKRPAACRYAIVGEWDVTKHSENILVLDLDETRHQVRTGKLVPPKPKRVCEDVDQAIMATLMLYEND